MARSHLIPLREVPLGKRFRFFHLDPPLDVIGTVKRHSFVNGELYAVVVHFERQIDTDWQPEIRVEVVP